MIGNYTYKISNVKEVNRAVDKGLIAISKTVYGWLRDERDFLVGSKAGHSKRKRKGIRDIIANKPRKNRKGKFGKGLAAQWKGKVFGHEKRINSMGYEAGLFPAKKGIRQGLIRMHTGYSQKTSRYMIVPIYKNLRKIGYTGPFFSGMFTYGLKSKAFKNLKHKLFIKEKDGKIFYYNKDGYNRKRKKFRKSDLLFIGVKNISVSKIFTGKYDIRERFDKQISSSIARAEKALAKTIKKIK